MNHYYFYNEVDEHYRHEVHTTDCIFLPALSNRTYIGYKADCHEAIASAKREYPGKTFDGCFYCSESCHRG